MSDIDPPFADVVPPVAAAAPANPVLQLPPETSAPLGYARGNGLRRQWWSRRAGAALFFAIIALPSPFLSDYLIRRYGGYRYVDHSRSLIAGVFFGCCALAVMFSVAARLRFDKTKGELPRGRWLAEIAFFLAIVDATTAGLILWLTVKPR